MEWISYLQITTSNKTTNFSDSLWSPFPYSESSCSGGVNMIQLLFVLRVNMILNITTSLPLLLTIYGAQQTEVTTKSWSFIKTVGIISKCQSKFAKLDCCWMMGYSEMKLVIMSLSCDMCLSWYAL